MPLVVGEILGVFVNNKAIAVTRQSRLTKSSVNVLCKHALEFYYGLHEHVRECVYLVFGGF